MIFLNVIVRAAKISNSSSCTLRTKLVTLLFVPDSSLPTCCHGLYLGSQYLVYWFKRELPPTGLCIWTLGPQHYLGEVMEALWKYVPEVKLWELVALIHFLLASSTSCVWLRCDLSASCAGYLVPCFLFSYEFSLWNWKQNKLFLLQVCSWPLIKPRKQ